MKDHRRKSFVYRGLNGLLACLLLWSVFAQPLCAAGITLELPGRKPGITLFERHNPVYSMIVDQGTGAAELELPDTFRAVCPLKDVQMDGFVQARPQRGSSGGQDDYDYYYYGYVAPWNQEELYRENKPVVYTIYYAGTGEMSQEVPVYWNMKATRWIR